MPTFDKLDEFRRDWALLAPEQQQLFRLAARKFFADLVAHAGFRKGLRVKGVRGHPGVFEMTWAPDGRATFEYGNPVRDGHIHVVWRRVGTHTVLKNP